MRYKYCPLCGTKLIPREAGDDGNIPFCTECDKYWFDTFADAVIVMVVNEFNEIALLRQSYLSDKYASFVAGYITPGETAESTAVREVKEEIGIDVDRIEYDGTMWFAKGELLMHCFIGYAKKSPLVLSKEVDSATWTPCKEVINTLFPDAPGNAAYAMYMRYMEKF